MDHAELEPAETCLVHGGGGGVGHVAVQLATILGGIVVATAGSQAARRAVEDLGADTVVPYRHDALQTAVLDACRGGVDVVLDHRFDDYAQFDADVAAFGGRIVVYGGDGGELADARRFRSKEIRTHWMSMSNLANRAGTLPTIGDVLSSIGALVERGDLSVEIADVYRAADAIEIHSDVMNGSFVGKLVYLP